MLSSTSGPVRSRSSIGRHPHVTRYASNPIPVADPNQMFGWYASEWADDPLNTPPADGGSISTWRNAGSLGTAFEQATGASQPTYDASLSTFNGFAAQDYDGTDDKLTILSGVSLAQPFTATFLGVADTLSQQNLLGLNDGATGRGLRISATGQILYVSAAGSVSSAAGVISVGVPFLAICYVTGTTVIISVNNVTVASGSLVGDDVNQIVVGSGRNSGGSFANPFNGKANFVSLITGFPYLGHNATTLIDFARARGCPIA